jgi:hypothetical protein
MSTTSISTTDIPPKRMHYPSTYGVGGRRSRNRVWLGDCWKAVLRLDAEPSRGSSEPPVASGTVCETNARAGLTMLQVSETFSPKRHKGLGEERMRKSEKGEIRARE